MKLIIGLILLGVLTQTTLGKSIVKRDCCCDSYNDCDSSCSVPCNYRQTNNCNNGACNRGRNCEQNNSCNKPDNKETVPILIPFPQPQEAQNYLNNPTIVNNTNINNNTIELTLTNTINTVNNVSVPITVNSTNENTITMYLTSKKEESEVDNNIELDEIRQSNCCIVSSIRCDQNNKCVRVKHRECSDVCSGIINIEDSRSTATPILKPQNNTQSNSNGIHLVRPLPIPQPSPIPLPQPSPQPCSQPLALPLPQPSPVPLPQPSPQPCSQPLTLPLPQPSPVPLPQPSPQPCSQPLPLQLPQPFPRRLLQPQPMLPPQCGVYVMGCQQQPIQPVQPTIQTTIPSDYQQNYGTQFNQPQSFRQLFTLQQEQQQQSNLLQSLPQKSVQIPYTGEQQIIQPCQPPNQRTIQDIIQPVCQQNSQQFTQPERFRQFYTVQQQPNMFYNLPSQSMQGQQLGYTVSSGQQQLIQPLNHQTVQAITLPRFVYPSQQFSQPQNSRQGFRVQHQQEPNILDPHSIQATQKSGQYVQPSQQQQESNIFQPQSIRATQLGYTQNSGQYVQSPQQQQESNIFHSQATQLGYTQNSGQIHPTFYPYQNEQLINNIQSYNPYLRDPSPEYN